MYGNHNIVINVNRLRSLYASLFLPVSVINISTKYISMKYEVEKFHLKNIHKLIHLVHLKAKKIYIEIEHNISFKEYIRFMPLLKKWESCGIDGVIINDLSDLFYFKTYFPNMLLYGGEGLKAHNYHDFEKFIQLGLQKINVSSQLNLKINDWAHAELNIDLNNNISSNSYVHKDVTLRVDYDFMLKNIMKKNGSSYFKDDVIFNENVRNFNFIKPEIIKPDFAYIETKKSDHSDSKGINMPVINSTHLIIRLNHWNEIIKVDQFKPDKIIIPFNYESLQELNKTQVSQLPKNIIWSLPQTLSNKSWSLVNQWVVGHVDLWREYEISGISQDMMFQNNIYSIYAHPLLTKGKKLAVDLLKEFNIDWFILPYQYKEDSLMNHSLKGKFIYEIPSCDVGNIHRFSDSMYYVDLSKVG